jgi:type II secretory pathway predicted ATPase ExeA
MFKRDHRLLSDFGCDANAVYWTDVHEHRAETIRDAVAGRQLHAVIGPYGSGKSMLTREALSEVDELVYVNNPDRRKMRIGHVMSAIIYEMGQGNPKRGTLARQYQVERVLGESAVRRSNKIAVVLENAHRLHHRTLMAIKDLMETADYNGVSPLFGCILVGQEPLSGKLDKHGEVKHRTREMWLTESEGWMTLDQRIEYLQHIYGDVITPEMKKRLATLYTSPLELDHKIDEHLRRMREAGIERMTWEHAPLPLDELRQAAGLSVRQVESISGVPKSTVSDAEHGKTDDPEVEEQIVSSIDDFIAEQNGDGSTPAHA